MSTSCCLDACKRWHLPPLTRHWLRNNQLRHHNNPSQFQFQVQIFTCCLGLNPIPVTLQTKPSAPLQWPLPWSKPPSFALCLADVKPLDEAALQFWEVSAGRHLNIWTARSASNNAAFVPLPYSLLTSQLRVASRADSRAGSRLLHRCRGAAAAQRGSKRPLAKIYMLQQFLKYYLVLNRTRAHKYLQN